MPSRTKKTEGDITPSSKFQKSNDVKNALRNGNSDANTGIMDKDTKISPKGSFEEEPEKGLDGSPEQSFEKGSEPVFKERSKKRSKEGSEEGLTPRQRNLALLAGLSVALYTVENLIPLPIPWLRIGIGNVGVLMALYMLGPLDGFFVLLIKILVGSLLSGRFLSPFFLFALGAGIPSYWIMAGVKQLFGRVFGPVGVSVTGALFHNLFQLGIAYVVVLQSAKIFYLAPVLVIIGTVAGFLIGALVQSILKHLDKGTSHVDTMNARSRIVR
jgi:heptaprenyl diphosphate synthase